MFFIDEEDEEDPQEKAARKQERDRLRSLRNGHDKNPIAKEPWNIMDTGSSLYRLFASVGIVHATPEQLKSHEERGLNKIQKNKNK